MVEYLVRTAAVLELDLNHVDQDGANALFYCAASGRLNLLRLLLKVNGNFSLFQFLISAILAGQCPQH